MRWPVLQQLVCEFAFFVRNQKIEHLLVVEASGRIRRKKERSGSVSSVVGVRSAVCFEIHNHPIPANQLSAFLHPEDLGAAFLAPNRCFSTTAVLFQVPDFEHIISGRFKIIELRKLLRHDSAVLKSLHERIQNLHNTAQRLKFQKLVLKSRTIFQLREVYKAEFPMLDFEIFELCA